MAGYITLFEFDSSLGEFIYSNLPLLNMKIKIKECLFWHELDQNDAVI